MNGTVLTGLMAWLMTYALHSTVLLAAAWALSRRRVSPAVLDVAWKAALVGGIVTASVQGMLERRPAGTFTLAAAAAAPAPVALGADAASAPDPLVREPGAAADVLPGGTADAGSSPAVSEGTGARRAPWAGPAAGLAALWLVTALVLVAWYLGRRLILIGRLGDRQPVVDGDTLRVFEELRRDARSHRTARLTTSATISSPVALRGEICLPAQALAELDTTQRRAMLAHELAHLERRDPQWLALACVIERALFFQPLNRLARSGMQRNAEYLADAWAASHGGGLPLAKALVKVAEWMQASPLSVPVAGFAEERSQLAVRVTRLVEGVTLGRGTRAAALAGAVAVLAFTTAFAPGVTQRATLMPTEDPKALRGLAPMAGEPDGAPTPTAADTALVRAVMARLRDEDAEVRRAAAHALGRMKHPMAIDALVIALDDMDAEVRHASLDALSNFDRGRVPTPPIRRMLDNADEEMRTTALRILAEERDRAAIPAITKLLADPNADVRYAALQALEELDAPVSEEALGRALADPSADVREAAAHYASDRQVVAVVPQLILMLDDRQSSVREHAAEALTEMRTPAATQALRRALTHRDPAVRRIAVEYFGEEVDP